MFRASLDYPTRAPHGGRAVLIGGTLLVSVPLLLATAGVSLALAPIALLAPISWLIVRGYHVRVIRTTIGRSNPSPPPFDRFGALLVDGLKATLISASYLLPAVGILVVAGGIANRQDLSEATLAVTAVQAVAGIVAIVTILYLVGALYALPVAVARFAHDEFGAAFEIRAVVDGAMSEDYAVAWSISAGIQLFFAPFAYLLYPIVVGFFLRFYLSVAVRYLYGRGVGSALGLDPVGRPPRSTLDREGVTPAVRRVDEFRQ